MIVNISINTTSPFSDSDIIKKKQDENMEMENLGFVSIQQSVVTLCSNGPHVNVLIISLHNMGFCFRINVASNTQAS